ncbi:zinc ribbon domain-containing protein [Blastopirellula sediminis]|uniref:zinc ribbon domain-containing protein n=1 Tax=Blastopirellula sediminis TaxID=2894196 RepID=UPI0021BC4296|nr:zinc ribbon domain-containing protein [Blastopirellula sediminis]
MTDIRVVCPCCGVPLRAKAQLAGQTIRCPKCVSLVPIKAPEDDFAQPVEANYDAVPLEENNVGRVCPKCASSLKPGGKLCKQCGWHLELEACFEDLKEENLIVRDEPKTKWEAWFESQLHENTRPRDVLNFSAIVGVVMSIIFLAGAHLRFGMWGLLLSPLLIVAWIAWYRFMQLIGLLHDPTRQRILEKERAERAANPTPSSPAPTAEVAVAAPASGKTPQPSGGKPPSTSPLSFDLPDAELPGQSKPTPKPKSEPPKPQRKVIRPAASGQPATTTAGSKPKPKPAAPAAPAPNPTPETPAKPKPSDDDWLNDLL